LKPSGGGNSKLYEIWGSKKKAITVVGWKNPVQRGHRPRVKTRRGTTGEELQSKHGS